jgi:NADPH-dependent glutamate synthase beta subunit-like oxidoreductase
MLRLLPEAAQGNLPTSYSTPSVLSSFSVLPVQATSNVDDWGFIKVDKQMKTNISNVYAIGDIVGQPMLAHKAVHEAKVAAEKSMCMFIE